MSNRIRILSSDHDNSKYFIDEKLKHALEVNQSITCFNGSFDLFFGYKVDSVDVDLINHNVTVVLHEDDFFDQMVKLLTIMQMVKRIKKYS